MHNDYFTAFLIGFSSMFAMHYLMEPTWGVGEPRPYSTRMITNYVIGTVGIAASFLYLHPGLWLDMAVSISGAAAATVLAHSRDWLLHLIKRDKVNGLIENSKDPS